MFKGSYHPDQYSQYSSAVSLNFNHHHQRTSSSPHRQALSVPDVHQRAGFDQNDGIRERRQQSPSSDIHKKNTMPSRKKLKVLIKCISLYIRPKTKFLFSGATFHIPLTKSATLNRFLHCSLWQFSGALFYFEGSFLFSRALFCISGAKSPRAPV